MKREYKAQVEVGRPRLPTAKPSPKERSSTISTRKQTGGSGQFGRVSGFLNPWKKASMNLSTRSSAALSLENSSVPAIRVFKKLWKRAY
jgi:hypothetical protein